MNIIAANGAMVPRMAEGGSAALGRRVASAMVMVPVAVGSVYLGGWYFALPVAGLGILMVFEWDSITGGGDAGAFTAAQAVLPVLAVILTALDHTGLAVALTLLGAVLLSAAARALGREPLWPGLGALWFSLPCLALVWLRGQGELGSAAVLGVLFVVWACDTGAYFTGRTVGGPRLAPRWSPNKTWSGLIGGAVSAAVVAAVFVALWGGEAPLAPALLFAAALAGAGLAVISQIGDLAESAVKRHFGVKDSGRLIPGHGGVLDRVDGLLFAAPALALAMLFGGRGL